MKRALIALVGVMSVLGAVALAAGGVTAAATNPLVVTGVALLAVVGTVGALVKIAGQRGEGDAVPAAPWRPGGAIIGDAPERSPADVSLSGEGLASVVEDAGATARDEGTVSAGLEVVRPELRTALVEALVGGGTDREAAEGALAEGTWTADETAAAVLDDSVDHPGWSLRERFEAWLFPERVVRREVKQAVRAVAATAEDSLPTVPGQHAPRSVTVLRPTLEDMRRGADGHLQRAADPLDARRGSPVDVDVTVRDAATVSDASAGDDGPDADERGASGGGTGATTAPDPADDGFGGSAVDGATGGDDAESRGPRVDPSLLEAGGSE